MDTRQEFIDAIQAEPGSDTPRLIFADWLEDEGDSQAELIRLQCQLAAESKTNRIAANNPLRIREKELLREFSVRWIEPLKALGARDVYISRGFVDEIRIRTADYAEHGDEILQIAPALRILNLRRSKKHLDELLKSPRLERIRAINLRLAGLEARDVARIVSCSRLSELTALSLFGNRIRDNGFASVVHSPILANLRILDLGANNVGTDGMLALAASNALVHLRELTLSNNRGIGNGDLEVLSSWPGLRQLDRLELSGCAIDLQGLNPLIRSANWNPDTKLQISRVVGEHSITTWQASNRQLVRFRASTGANVEYIQDPFYRFAENEAAPDDETATNDGAPPPDE